MNEHTPPNNPERPDDNERLASLEVIQEVQNSVGDLLRELPDSKVRASASGEWARLETVDSAVVLDRGDTKSYIALSADMSLDGAQRINALSINTFTADDERLLSSVDMYDHGYDDGESPHTDANGSIKQDCEWDFVDSYTRLESDVIELMSDEAFTEDVREDPEASRAKAFDRAVAKDKPDVLTEVRAQRVLDMINEMRQDLLDGPVGE